jgi:hypothetical protein
MSKDVSVEWRDGEVVITKHADTAEARETIAAIKRAMEFFDKNSDEDRPEAFRPGPGDRGPDDEDEEDETELSPRGQARRRRQLAENVRETGRLESTRKDLAMIDPDVLISQVSKGGLGFAMVKRFVEKTESDELTESQVTTLLLAEFGKDFAKRFQADTPEGRIARQAVEKARNAQWAGAHKAASLTGERALASVSQPRGEKADPLRERIIRDKAVASPFLSQEQLAAYADAMVAELERVTRGRARPGTLESV